MAIKKEDKLTKEKLLAEIERLKKELKKRKKYGLVWEEKPEEVVEICKKKLPVLKEVKSREIMTDPNKPVNLLIEGDNYHALSVLNYTHEKKIDVFYIDPPFNTGAKDWKYNNDYVDENDAYRHSKWLSLMKHRLVLARNLLSPKGVLICAIDENEHATLGLLLQEIFYNYKIDCITIVHNPRGVQGENFSYCHEYAYFVYPNKGRFIGRKQRNDEGKEYSNLRNWGGESTREYGKSLFYPIYFKDGKFLKTGEVPPNDFHPSKPYAILEDGTIEFWPIDNNGVERKWRYSRETLAQISHLIRVNDVGGILQVQILKEEDRYKTVWTDKKYDANIYGTQLVKEILGKEFPFPKSLYNVKECLDAVAKNNKKAIILDYFAGSGTTAHAVLEMNKIDNGDRSFILCTNNENNICDEICYPRVRNVINGYKFQGKDKRILYENKLTFSKLKNMEEIIEEMDQIIEDNQKIIDEIEIKIVDNTIKIYGIKNISDTKEGLGGNLKYYRTDFVDAEPTDRNKKKLTGQATEMLCIREGTFEQVLEKNNFKIFKNNKHYTGIIFDQLDIQEFKKAISDIKGKFSVYVFSLGDDTFNEEFEDIKWKVRLSPIPEAILRVYRRIFK
jgi:adenine-specific DNA-methyltransferase